MSRHVSPYHVPGMYEDAIARGRHRDIIGGRWEETGVIQMEMLERLGVRPDHRLLDIGCGPLRTGCRLVPWLDAGNYWGTDASLALMMKGYEDELTVEDRMRLPRTQLIEDANFDFPGLPDDFDWLLCFAVFTHLPMPYLRRALLRVAQHFTRFQGFAFTVFLAPSAQNLLAPCRQPDGVVTHDCRAPYHLLAEDVAHFAAQAGLALAIHPDRLPRGQVLCLATRS